MWMQDIATTFCQTAASGGQTLQTILPLTHTGLEELDVGKDDVATNLSNKNCTTNFREDAKSARWNYNFPRQQHGQTGLLVCQSALGPPVLLWPALFFVKLWRQSRRAQKPAATSACTHCTVVGGHVANVPASAGTEGCCSRVAPGVVKASRRSSPLPAAAEGANACSRTGWEWQGLHRWPKPQRNDKPQDRRAVRSSCASRSIRVVRAWCSPPCVGFVPLHRVCNEATAKPRRHPTARANGYKRHSAYRKKSPTICQHCPPTKNQSIKVVTNNTWNTSAGPSLCRAPRSATSVHMTKMSAM